MKSNFGTRWEGQTRWFKPSARGGLEPSAPPMRSVYQLEFPSATPELGAWRGWSVIEPGDTRVVPLAEATVMERTAGSTTFQFAGAGGRVSLRTDGDGWGCEVNFFHARRRSGLCAFYGAGGELRGAMSMRFRAAPISRDGNGTFVGGGEYTVDHDSETLTEVWNFDPDVYAGTNGDAWRLENGNTLHVIGSAGHVVEVNPDSEVIWHLNFGDDHLMGRGEFINDLYTLAKGSY